MRMSDKIDLGISDKDQYGDMGMGSPTSPGSFGRDSGKQRYPSFHYSGPEELELPDEGEMTIAFKKTSETSRTRRDGSRWYECDIEVCCICDVEDDEEGDDDSEVSAGDALDVLAKKLHVERSNDEG